jgi:hypothetical protein
MFELYEYFLTIRIYFLLESLVFLAFLVACMIRFGKFIQGDEKPLYLSSPQPASRLYSVTAFLLWLAGAVMATQTGKILVIAGICLMIAALQLGFHVNLMLMGVWYLSRTGRPMLGLGGLKSREKHKVYLEHAKERGRLSLERAKGHGPIWREQVMRW